MLLLTCVVCLIQVQRHFVPAAVASRLHAYCVYRLALRVAVYAPQYHWGVEHSTQYKTRLLHLIITFYYLSSLWITGPTNWNTERVYHQSLVCSVYFRDEGKYIQAVYLIEGTGVLLLAIESHSQKHLVLEPRQFIWWGAPVTNNKMLVINFCVVCFGSVDGGNIKDYRMFAIQSSNLTTPNIVPAY